MQLTVNQNTVLELIAQAHAPAIFDIVQHNREHLRQWLGWVDRAQDVQFIENFVAGAQHRHAQGTEYSFVMITDGRVVGRIGLYKLDAANQSAEIGYWIAADQQGRGLVLQSCQRLLQFCFEELGLHRLEIRCGTSNRKSQRIPQLLGFEKEGTLRQAEYLHGAFIDLDVFGLLRQDYLKA